MARGPKLRVSGFIGRNIVINIRHHASIKPTPYVVVYGQPPLTIICYGQTKGMTSDSMDRHLQDRHNSSRDEGTPLACLGGDEEFPICPSLGCGI